MILNTYIVHQFTNIVNVLKTLENMLPVKILSKLKNVAISIEKEFDVNR